MELSLLLIQQIGQLFIILFLGFVLVKVRLLRSKDSKVIAKLSLYVVCPVSIINSFAIEFTPDKLAGLGIAFLGALLSQVLYLPLTSLLSKILKLQPIEKASAIYSNAGNLIIPLVGALLGKDWILYTSGYMVVQTVLLWTHGKNLVCEEKSLSFKKIFLNINLIAVIIGFILFIFQLPLPGMVTSTMTSISGMLGPLAMIVIGMTIAEMRFKEIFTQKRAYLICFLRLVLYPLIVILLLKLLNLRGISPIAEEILLITILAASAPTATTITQFSQLYDKNAGYASTLNVLGVVFSIVTMPLMVMLYQMI